MRLRPASWLLVALFLFAVTSTPPSTATSIRPTAVRSVPIADSAAQTPNVSVTADGVDPDTITVTVGATVQWTNQDDVSHTVMAVDGSFGPLSMPSQSDTVTYTFETAGSYPYLVAPLNVTGVVVVIGAVATPTETAVPSDTAAPTASATPTATLPAAPTDTPTNTPTDISVATATATPTATDSATPSPSATQTPLPSATPPGASPTSTAVPYTPSGTPTLPLNVDISLVGSVAPVCMPTIPPGSVVTWSNDNPPGGPSYVLQGVSANFGVTSDDIVPGQSESLPFPNAGVYLYNIISGSQVLVANAQITVAAGNVIGCPVPTPSATPTSLPVVAPSATPTAVPSSTSSATAIPSPTNTATPTPTPPATSTATPTARPTAPSAQLQPPSPTPPAYTPVVTHTAEPKHPKPSHHKPAPCASIAWKRAGEIRVTAAGYLRRGRGRVDLTLSLDARGGRLRGSLRLRDPGARLAVTLTRFTRLRWLCQGLVVDGSARAGRRLLPLKLLVTKGGRILSASISIAALRYHVTGAVHGRATLLAGKAAIHAATKGHTPPTVQHGHARRKPAKGRPAHGP